MKVTEEYIKEMDRAVVRAAKDLGIDLGDIEGFSVFAAFVVYKAGKLACCDECFVSWAARTAAFTLASRHLYSDEQVH